MGTHWPFRKARRGDWPRLIELLLGGKPVRAAEAEGWLVDVAAPLEGALQAAWELASGEAGAGVARRAVEEGALAGVREALPAPGETGEANGDAARAALHGAVVAACSVPLAEALELQSRRSAAFMTGKACRAGVVGQAAARMT